MNRRAFFRLLPAAPVAIAAPATAAVVAAPVSYGYLTDSSGFNPLEPNTIWRLDEGKMLDVAIQNLKDLADYYGEPEGDA